MHLAGRTLANLEAVARSIRSADGIARVAQLDVLDTDALRRHATSVADTSGSIDVCFNATSNDDIEGKSLLDMPVGEFMQPVTKALTVHHGIVTAVAPHMVTRGGGVILVMGGGREAIPRLGIEPSDNRTHDTPPAIVGLIPRHQPSLWEVAGLATFLASDFARTITATEINITGGVVID